MRVPKLQIALDHNNLETALSDVIKVGNIVDIIEVGTILCLQEGHRAISCIRSLFPEKIIVADTKCADAGKTVAKNVSDAGADFMTVICCATIPTMEAAKSQVKELQVELYGDWTYEQAGEWRRIGIKQAIYHQSRDALFSGQSWGENDLVKVKKLIEMGFDVSVTGGLDVGTLKLFSGIPVYNFITGRGISEAANPKEAALQFKEEISLIWG